MRCFLLWSFLVSVDTIELSNMFGEILSPGFPESYPSDSEVSWNVSVPDGFRVRLYFMHFDLEPSYLCEYDYVKSKYDLEMTEDFHCANPDMNCVMRRSSEHTVYPSDILTWTLEVPVTSSFECDFKCAICPGKVTRRLSDVTAVWSRLKERK